MPKDTPDKKAFRKWTNEICVEMRRQFAFSAWQMHVYWNVDEDYEHDDADTITKAIIKINPNYMVFNITLYRRLFQYWEEGEYTEIIETLEHEFTHLLLDPLHQIAKDTLPESLKDIWQSTVEHQTSHIAKLIAEYKPQFPKRPKRRSKRV